MKTNKNKKAEEGSEEEEDEAEAEEEDQDESEEKSTVSLFGKRENFTTYLLSKSDDEIRGKSFVWSIMKKLLGEENAEAAIKGIAFTKDHMGLVFDVSSEYDELITEKWYDTASLGLKAVTEMPEIEV